MYPGELTLWQSSALAKDSSVRHLTTGTISGTFEYVPAVPAELHCVCTSLAQAIKVFLERVSLGGWSNEKNQVKYQHFFSCANHHTGGHVDMTPHFTAVLWERRTDIE